MNREYFRVLVRKALLVVFILLVISLSLAAYFAYPVNADSSGVTYDDVDYNFLTAKDALAGSIAISVMGSAAATYISMIDVTNAYKKDRSVGKDYSTDLFMPVEEWEYRVCMQGLSSQLKSDDGSGVSSTGNDYGIYADTSTVSAYVRLPKNVSDSKLYEITWYFQPIGGDKDYAVELQGPAGEKQVVQKKTTASTKTGASGFLPVYSNMTFNKAVMTYDSTAHYYPIINTSDTNR